ncbi:MULTISPECIES: hypothetical protein [unclassified Acidovorax]|uniref:hypothetical protein n=1 Tax=unclassified Acidovorax TaxID=2684926 RepID=UPI000AC0F078|nr:MULTISPECIES: hypothetical protein [unclassified Acidovorax]
MFRKISVAGLVLVAMLLTGCIQAPKKTAFNQAMATNLKTVLIVRDPDQDRYEAVMIGHPGAGFGLIGALVATADMHAKGSRLTEAIDVNKTTLRDRFEKVLAEKLQAQGYTTARLVLPKDVKEEDMLATARKMGVQADAVLCFRLNGGYVAAGPTSDYFPSVGVKVVLSDQLDKELYADTFSYGYTAPQSKAIHFTSDEQYRFSNIDTLISDPQKTRQGLIAGLDVLATQISLDLKRP